MGAEGRGIFTVICLVFVLNFLFCCSAVNAFVPGEQITPAEELEFIEAELRDIIYTFAAAYGIDVYVFESVRARASLRMSKRGDIDVLKDLISGSGYCWEERGEIIYIGTEEEISRLRDEKDEVSAPVEQWAQTTLTLRGDWDEDWDELLDKFYPEVLRVINHESGIIVLAGEEEIMQRKKSFLKALFPAEPIPREPECSDRVEIVAVPGGELYDYSFLEVLSDLNHRHFCGAGFLYLSGPDRAVGRAEKLVEEYLARYRIEERIITLIYLSAEELAGIFPREDESFEIHSLDESTVRLRGRSRTLSDAEKLIGSMDSPPGQVLIEFEIMEFSQSESEGDYLPGLPEIKLEMEESGRLDINLSWETYIRKARESGVMEILASARIVTLTGETARLHIGESLPVIVGEEEDKKLEYLDAGIILEVLAEINELEEINLMITPEVSTAEMTTTGYPAFNTRRLKSSIRMEHGETFYLGGVSRDQKYMSEEEHSPFVHLPLIGELFRREYQEKENSELIISVTPYLLERGSPENESRDDLLEKQEIFSGERIK